MPKGPWGLARFACSAIQASGVALPTPIIPKPPPALTAPANIPPDQLAMGAETIGCLRPNVRVSSVDSIAHLRASPVRGLPTLGRPPNGRLRLPENRYTCRRRA